MRLARLILAMLVAALLCAAPAAAQTFPKFSGNVVDAANVLPPATVADLTAKLQKLQQDTHRQLVVVTVPDTQGYPLEDYGYRLGREWGVGLRDVDNGAILFLAPGNPAGQRGPRIEVGRGLEAVIPDALADQIARQQMAARLKAEGRGAIPAVMEQGTDALIAQLRAAPEEAKARTDAAVAAFDKVHRRAGAGHGGGFPLGAILVLLVVGFIVLSALRRGRGGQSWRGGVAPVVLWGPGLGGGWGGGWGGGSGGGWGSSGGSSWGSGGGSDGSWGGGGFTGGGGGSFGGGGASGDW